MCREEIPETRQEAMRLTSHSSPWKTGVGAGPEWTPGSVVLANPFQPELWLPFLEYGVMVLTSRQRGLEGWVRFREASDTEGPLSPHLSPSLPSVSTAPNSFPSPLRFSSLSAPSPPLLYLELE